MKTTSALEFVVTFAARLPRGDAGAKVQVDAIAPIRMRKLKVIPAMQCDEHCGECCGLVPVTQTEFRRVERFVAENNIVPIEHDDGTCPLYQNGTCTVYPARPLICQLFGHSPDPLMTCPRGYNVNLPERDVVRMLSSNGRTTRVLHELLPQWRARMLTERARQDT